VRVQQGALGSRRQLRRLGQGLAGRRLTSDLAGQRIRGGPGAGQDLPGRLELGGGPQQVLGIQVSSAPFGHLRRGGAE
jgi:hypothetical protein